MHKQPLHLVIIISGHGFGHASMTAPILNALYQQRANVRITIRSRAPRWFFEQYYHLPFDYCEEACDFGMAMNDAFSVNLDRSRQAYNAFHQHWPEQVKSEEVRLRALGADLVLSNIAYLPLVAAKRIGIPAIAYCCLNWADIYRHYFSADAIYQTMLEAYNGADLFLRPAPSMPMPDVRTHAIGPVAAQGKGQRESIKTKLHLKQTTRLILASLGGVATKLGSQHWPRLPNSHYLIADQTGCERSDVSNLDQAGVSFTDAIASCNAFITKPGYGAFSEAACHGVPVLYAKRVWPEQPYLVEWLQQQLPCAEITPEELQRGRFATQLESLLNTPTMPAVAPSGIPEALQQLGNFIDKVAP